VLSSSVFSPVYYLIAIIQRFLSSNANINVLQAQSSCGFISLATLSAMMLFRDENRRGRGRSGRSRAVVAFDIFKMMKMGKNQKIMECKRKRNGCFWKTLLLVQSLGRNDPPCPLNKATELGGGESFSSLDLILCNNDRTEYKELELLNFLCNCNSV